MVSINETTLFMFQVAFKWLDLRTAWCIWRQGHCLDRRGLRRLFAIARQPIAVSCPNLCPSSVDFHLDVAIGAILCRIGRVVGQSVLLEEVLRNRINCLLQIGFGLGEET